MIFAKDDNHATEIVDIAKNVFKPEFENDAIPEKFVQKITYSVGDSNALIRDLRTEKDFRIAVTVTLVATGTDVKPLEVVLFMKDVHSDVLYTQMKGRGCRVISDDKLKEVTPNADTKECYYIVDAVGVTDYDLSIVEQRMLNPEFAELVKVGKIYYNGQANENLDIAVMENRAGTLALKAMQIINELKRNWTDDSIDYWKALRELCLMRPTLSRKNVEQNSQYQLVYMCAPGETTAYSYEQEGDYNKNINIKFDGSLSQKMSEDEVHLKEIMQIPGVKALFEKHGYATSFVPNEFILTPPMFNNIYKGALGEVVGKYILEQYAGVTLQEMPPEFFELFDYTLGNGVYVDFKLWKETMLISAEEEKKNVLEKLDKCGGKRAVIINIMLDHNMQITSSDNGRIIEIPYLYRLDRKEIGTEIIAKINREGYLQ